MTDLKNFIDIEDIDAKDLKNIISRAREIKADLKSGKAYSPLVGKHLAMIFEKSSTRTRVSFEVGINQLGGHAIILDSQNSQMGRGETVADTAKVLSRYIDIIMARTYKHETLKELAEHGNVPVINGLSDHSHPCQIMTDIMTFEEHKGSIEGKIIAWIGDCNNMATSWIQAAEKFKFLLHISTPAELAPPSIVSEYVKFFSDPQKAVEHADAVNADTWVSMGDDDAEHKLEILADFQVNDELMALAKEDAIFLHCLPAHRDEEVSESVIDGAQSVVFDEAENRLHVQKAIILWCLGKL
jgi:ornithine carbamoyltransferase